MGAGVLVAEALPFEMEDVGGQSLPVLESVLLCLDTCIKGIKNLWRLFCHRWRRDERFTIVAVSSCTTFPS
jgi:hypothetical protein